MPRERGARWSEVDAWRIAQSALTRDLVRLKRRAAGTANRDQGPGARGQGEEEWGDGTLLADIARHESALALASEKLASANLAYYEARDAWEHQPRPEPHAHTH